MGGVACCCTEEGQGDQIPIPLIAENPVFARLGGQQSEGRLYGGSGPYEQSDGFFGTSSVAEHSTYSKHVSNPNEASRTGDQYSTAASGAEERTRLERCRRFQNEVLRGKSVMLMRQVGASDVEIVKAILVSNASTDSMMVKIKDISVKWAASSIQRVRSVASDGAGAFPLRVINAVTPENQENLLRLDCCSATGKPQTLFFLEDSADGRDYVMEGLLHMAASGTGSKPEL